MLFVSKKVHDESKAATLKRAQIDVSIMINHCRHSGLTPPPFDVSIVRHIFYRCEYALVVPPALLGVTGTASNLVSLTFAHVPANDCYLDKSDVEIIRRRSWKILGRSASDTKPRAPTRDLIDIWEHCARSFKLVSELELLQLYDGSTASEFAVSVPSPRRSILLQLIPLQTGHYDLGTKMFKVESSDRTFEKHEFLVNVDF